MARTRPRAKTLAVGSRGIDPRGIDGQAKARLRALLAVMLVAFGAIALRVGQVQVLAADRYNAVGEQQRVRAVVLPAARGSIFDREGRDLALSMPQKTVWANPKLVVDPIKVADTLEPILGVPAPVLQARLSRDAGFVYLARKVDDEVAERVKKLDLGGVFFLDEPERFLPAGSLISSVLGKVGLDNDGLSGLELQYEDVLQGQPGELVAERDPRGREIAGGVRSFTPSRRGDDLVLTIDRSLQYETERALSAQITSANAKGGIAIVMETQTGEVLALANLVRDDEDGTVAPAPNNVALTNVYEPGSVNKLITIAGALEEGIIKPTDTLVVPDRIKVWDHVFTDHDPHPTKAFSITDIVAESSNVGLIKIGQKLGKARLDMYLRHFGLGSKTGIGFPGESRGILLDPKKWSGTSLPTITIGYGISVTAMQMLAAYNTVANGGEYVAPKLVRSRVGPDGRQQLTPDSARRRILSRTTADQMTAMLSEVVHVGTGTRAAIDGYTVAGKTGTARKPKVGAAGYREGVYMSTFAGFVPAERPALTSLVLLDEPTPFYGGLVAAPVFAQVMRYALREFRIPPPEHTG